MTNLQLAPEIWAQSPEIKYEVSSYGRIRNIKKKHILKPSIGSHGYYSCQCGENNTRTIHRLVARTFVPNPDNLEQVNHKDGNKLNNHVDNLEWVSRSDNAKHSFKLGLSYQTRCVKLNAYKNGVIIGSYNSMLEMAIKLNISRIDIYRFLQKKKTHVKGYTFSKQVIINWQP